MPFRAADVCDETLDAFLTRLASDAPAPGGGAAARGHLADMDDAEYVDATLTTLARLIDEAASLRGHLAALIAER